jgi:ubiquinol-cytochrome c reductase cytochrome c subunit
VRLVRAWWRRTPLLPRPARVILALALAAGALAALAAGGSAQPAAPTPTGSLVTSGARLFHEGCADCHGTDARGVRGRGPSLRGVGEQAADFYLRTGRMPLDDPHQQPLRAESPYTKDQIHALVAYVGSFGGPRIPAVDPRAGDLAQGMKVFGELCMGCHQVAAQGGITTEGVAPDLNSSRPLDVAEAVRVGPYVMPDFSSELSRHDIDSLARYVEYTKHPRDVGGLGIGHLGPVPEGMVAWLLAGLALVMVARLIGERNPE